MVWIAFVLVNIAYGEYCINHAIICLAQSYISLSLCSKVLDFLDFFVLYMIGLEEFHQKYS